MAQWRNVTQNHQITLEKFDRTMYLEWCQANHFDKFAADVFKSDDWVSVLKKKHKRHDFDNRTMCMADHGVVFRNSATDERVMVCHLYGYADEDVPKLESLCKEERLSFDKLQESWYYPGKATAYVIRDCDYPGKTTAYATRNCEKQITLKEYNKLRYRSNPRRTFEHEIRSNAKKLRSLGCIVTFPPEDELNAAIDNYLANRTRREKIDWEALTK